MVEAVVEFDYVAQEPDELSLRKGDIITNIRTQPGGWWEGSLKGRRGMFPDNFVKVVAEGSPAGQEVPGKKILSRRCRVLFSYTPLNDDELAIKVNDIVEILGEVEEGWWRGKLRNSVGVFPSNFVMELPEDSAHGNQKTRSSSREASESDGDVSASMSSPDSSQLLDNDTEAPSLPPKPVKEMCRVVYPYNACNEDELTLKEGDMVVLVSRDVPDQGWWKGELHGKVGLFPDNFVEVVQQDEAPKKPERPPSKSPLATTNRARDSITKPLAPVFPKSDSGESMSKKLVETALAPKTDEKEKQSAVVPPLPGKKPSLPIKKPQRVGLPDSLSKKQPEVMDGPSKIKSEGVDGLSKIKSEVADGLSTKRQTEAVDSLSKRQSETVDSLSKRQSEMTDGLSKKQSDLSDVLSKRQSEVLDSLSKRHSEMADGLSKRQSEMADGLSKRQSEMTDGLFKKQSDLIDSLSKRQSDMANSPLKRQQDIVDGGCLSRPRSGVGALSEFDSVERAAMLSHPTASRARAPRRRPPTFAKEAEMNGRLMNGSAEERLLEDSVQEEEKGTRAWERNKVPWMDELKLNQARKSSSLSPTAKTTPSPISPGSSTSKSPEPLVDKRVLQQPPSTKTRTEASPAHQGGSRLSNADVNDETVMFAPTEPVRPSSIATARQHGPRPQSMFEGAARPLPLARPLSMSTSPPDRKPVISPSQSSKPESVTSLSSLSEGDALTSPVPSVMQIAQLKETVLKLEQKVEQQRKEFSAALADLSAKLSEEVEKRCQIQHQLDKLSNLVTQV